MGVEGRTAIVTGGAQGIGRGIVERLGSEGANVMIGDLNADGAVTSGDIVFLVNYVFKGGASPVPLSFGDVNLSCDITAADIIYLVNFVFKSGPAPVGSCVP